MSEQSNPVWSRVKGGIKGSNRRSRTEGFLQYAEEHPDERMDSRQEYASREFDRELCQHQREQQTSSRPARATSWRAKLGPVPF